MTEALSPKAIFAEAIAHHQAGRLRKAEPLYRAALAIVPAHPDTNHNLGVLAMQVGQPGGALPFLRTALAADSTRPQFWASYVSALAQSGDADAARTAVSEARAAGNGTRPA